MTLAPEGRDRPGADEDRSLAFDPPLDDWLAVVYPRLWNLAARMSGPPLPRTLNAADLAAIHAGVRRVVVALGVLGVGCPDIATWCIAAYSMMSWFCGTRHPVPKSPLLLGAWALQSVDLVAGDVSALAVAERIALVRALVGERGT